MSNSVSHNGTIYVCGQIADDYQADLKIQTQQALDNLKEKLLAAGSNPEKLLATTVYMKDIREFEVMNQVWKAWFNGANMPTRATVETRLAYPELLIEIVAIAAV
jgi:enamine deaminase RidA (YjgF/YER057c/UK114 family)